jgi:unsaturated rhamnogalacturonyl hydrolase
MNRALFGLCLGLAACHDSLPSAADAAPELPDALTAAADGAPDLPDAAPDDGQARLAVLALMERVADRQIHALDNNNSSTWIEATFYAGLVATYTSTGKLRFLEDLLDWGDQNAWTPRADRMHPDNQCASQTYLEIHLLDGVAAHLAGTRQVMDQALAQNRRGRDVWWWCDALFMAPTVLARLGVATGDASYFDALNTKWWDVHDALFDPAADLFSRDAGYLNSKCPNGEKMFWARGNAWVVAGTVRVLQYLPEDYPDRGRYEDLLRRMTAKLAQLQRPDGFWSSCLTDPVAFPEPETSGTSGIVYAMAWGVNEGVLDHDTYLPVIRKGWHALAGAVDASGKLQWVQGVGSAPATTTQGETQPYGVGLFLLAGSEVARLADELD